MKCFRNISTPTKGRGEASSDGGERHRSRSGPAEPATANAYGAGETDTA
jgi:hypothetical protein